MGTQDAVAMAPVPEVPFPAAEPSVEVLEHVTDKALVTVNWTIVSAVVAPSTRSGSATNTTSPYSASVAENPTLNTRICRSGERKECLK